MSIKKEWIVAERAPDALLKSYRGVSRVIAQVLYNRGFTTSEQANRFLYVRNPNELNHQPMQMLDMSRAIGRIRTALLKNERIAVYGDFDADGVTSTTLMTQALRALGANVTPYIPHRIDEGYGLNTPALLKLAERGITLVITVDCGIRSVDEVNDARSAGLDVIITDHHSLGDELPNAYAVINPKRTNASGDYTYPEEMLAGVGVAYKVAEALAMTQAKNGRRGDTRKIDLEALLDLVAIGTVADIMPLNRLENRAFVRRGIDILRQAKRPGIRALLKVAGVEPQDVNAGTIGFAIGPRINAAGRLDDAMTAYHLLAAETEESAQHYAQKLQDLNVKRQDLTREAQETIRAKLGEMPYPLIFESDASLLPGIVGLVAGRLTEEYYLPSVIMELGEEESRASCRSVPGFDITAALDQCADLLVRHGGHALAAGFTVRNDNIDALKARLIDIATQQLYGQELKPRIEIDAVLNVHELNEELVKELALLEPTGNANRPPTFALMNAQVTEARTVGADNRHLKLRIARAGLPPLDAIGFGLGDNSERLNNARADLAFQLEMNVWNGKSTLQLRLVDVRLAEQSAYA